MPARCCLISRIKSNDSRPEFLFLASKLTLHRWLRFFTLTLEANCGRRLPGRRGVTDSSHAPSSPERIAPLPDYPRCWELEGSPRPHCDSGHPSCRDCPLRRVQVSDLSVAGTGDLPAALAICAASAAWSSASIDRSLRYRDGWWRGPLGTIDPTALRAHPDRNMRSGYDVAMGAVIGRVVAPSLSCLSLCPPRATGRPERVGARPPRTALGKTS
jgi:hypothetical protein